MGRGVGRDRREAQGGGAGRGVRQRRAAELGAGRRSWGLEHGDEPGERQGSSGKREEEEERGHGEKRITNTEKREHSILRYKFWVPVLFGRF